MEEIKSKMKNKHKSQRKYNRESNRNRKGKNISIYLRAEHLDKLKFLCKLHKKKVSRLIQSLIDLQYSIVVYLAKKEVEQLLSRGLKGDLRET